MSALEKESLEKTGLRSDVITLYNGGLYHLYRYRKFTDVRLVFAPEKDIASFGGDVDNFEYPRLNLDICFFRVYENNQPYRPEHWLKWDPAGPKEGDLVFVSGHPGATQRLETHERLLTRRDLGHPYTLARLRNREAALQQFAAQSPEFAKMAQGDFYSTANARKAFAGQYQGLLTPSILQRKWAEEQTLSAAPNGEAYKKALREIADAQKRLAPIYKEYSLLELGDAFDSQLFRIARHLVRLEAEKKKPNAERLREYRESALASLELQLYSPAPIHSELEQAKLSASLTFLAEHLGGGNLLVRSILGDANPANRAAELVNGSGLSKVEERKRIAAEGVEKTNDKILALARAVDEVARNVRKRYEEEVEEPERQAYAAIVDHKFKIHGSDLAPDATFTLRLAFGVVQGYTDSNGQQRDFYTTFRELYEREQSQAGKEPFAVPNQWKAKKALLNLDTRFNFVSTADTIGGNSGSPILNRKGEFIGINFDRNRHGLVRNFVYTDVQARHIAVHAAAIVESLKKVYDAHELLKELGVER
jgi:3-methyladenine DNA glycosylase/8-oxoguanine DNA glycosylase